MAAYTDEQRNWLKHNAASAMSYQELTDAFNAKFRNTKSVCAIQQQLAKQLHISIDSATKAMRYTEEEKKWLIKNQPLFYDYHTLADAFNARFQRNKSMNNIREFCSKRLKLRSNFGIGGNTKFKAGNRKEQLPIGTIREGKNGATYIKVQDAYLSHASGYKEPYWKPLQKKIYEDVYGPIPEGKMVVFLDCDRTNFELDNLYCIDRRISAVLAKNKWYTCDRELTLTAIKWCELYFELKKKK